MFILSRELSLKSLVSIMQSDNKDSAQGQNPGCSQLGMQQGDQCLSYLGYLALISVSVTLHSGPFYCGRIVHKPTSRNVSPDVVDTLF